MNALIELLPSGANCFVVRFTALSEDMCYYVMPITRLMNGDLEIFGRKL